MVDTLALQLGLGLAVITVIPAIVAFVKKHYLTSAILYIFFGIGIGGAIQAYFG